MKLFVGFDIQNSNIRIMNAEKPTDSASVDYLHFDSRIFSDEFFAEAQTLLQEYFVKKPSLLNLQAYVCLPNQAVGIETFNLPNMKRPQVFQALDAELVNLYEGAQKGKKINRFKLIKNKQYTTYGMIYFNKKLIASIYRLLTDVKVFPKETTYSGNALMNCAYGFVPKLRGASFVFADVHLDYTEIAVSSHGQTLGVAVIPLGASLIKTDKVELEYMQTNHTVGEIAVINAKESARAKSLTMSDVDPSVIPEGATIEDYAVDGARAAEDYSGSSSASAEEVQSAPKSVSEAEQPNAENQTVAESAREPSVTQPAEETSAQPAEENAEGAEGAKTDEDFYESEEEEQKRLAELSKLKLKKTKVYRKMPKRYPKFMVRELPDTEAGFQYENWRIIMKWILLYARQAELSEYTASPEFVLVNMPTELYHLLDMSNEEQGDGIKFRPFSAADKLSPEIKGNLNLYGCLFAKNFNKNHNF